MSNSFDHSGKEVRLRYVSIINFIVTACGVVGGLFYTMQLVRIITIEDYGIFIMIMRYVAYFSLPSGIYTTWLCRDISRGKNASKTGVYTALLFAVISLPIYFITIETLSIGLKQPLIPLLLSMGILFFELINAAFNSIVSGYKPQIASYGAFILGATQIFSGLLLFYVWYLGLTGAVIATLIGRMCLNFFLIKANYNVLYTSKFDKNLFKSWLKVSWYPLFLVLTNLIIGLDVLAVRVISGNEVSIAYYGICIGITSVTILSSIVTSSLYPLVLYKKNIEDLKEAIWLTLLLSIPSIFIIMF
jgi:O-antigen/teichoic acid export membrane protein